MTNKALQILGRQINNLVMPFYVLLSECSGSLTCPMLENLFVAYDLSLGPLPKILQGMRSPFLSLKLWKLKGIETTASEVVAKLKLVLWAANLFSDSAT